MQPIRWVIDTADAQRGALFLWVPVCLALGIAGYFSLRFEPTDTTWRWLSVASVCSVVLSRLVPQWIAPALIALVLIAGGAGIAKLRTDAVAGPVLTFRYYGPIEGRVVGLDRSASDAVRITLDQVVLNRMSPGRTPTKVRISVHGDQPRPPPQAGDRLILTGHLSPPAGPAEPGGFDFQRHAWFLKLGAVGYTRTPVLRIAEPDGAWQIALFSMRMKLSAAVRQSLEGETGSFAAAILTGDRSGMSQDTLKDLRRSNLAHLLAISGLHMGLLTGFIFAATRLGLSLMPRLALRLPVKKIAAVVALICGAFYLALSGGNVATERAYIMVSAMFVAVLLDRRALSLRAVAMAAILVLVLRPEALMGPGFQMSFAATTALVICFRSLRKVQSNRWPKPVQMVFSVIVSSAVAGAATAPIAAAHFNQISHFGLIANVISVPVMGILIMPAAVFAVCLAPFGLWSTGLAIMGVGLRWILFVAEKVSDRPDAVSHVVAPEAWVLGVISLGALWCVLWRGALRPVGLVGIMAAVWGWSGTPRPTLLIADSGSLIGLLTADGRVLSKPKGDGFVAGIWLENDGHPVAQEDAAARHGIYWVGRQRWATIGEVSVLQVSGKTALAELTECGGAQVLVSNQSDAGDRDCLVLDQQTLRDTGAISFSLAEGGAIAVQTSYAITGLRPWNTQQRRGQVSADIQVSNANGRPQPPDLIAKALP